ncbi:MAG: PAS domain S-box protein [candidate division Zixibacteria bacterium]|nr:PAS domain S-box protein [candidate division Zixibacteria bacterium]MDH3936699.1 PAS domain S-box protein [candidate division Zixibacteria bacterium]MDH4034071.1 PAS domain S-box protein [candidate division Zixibacteria bacterium]
MSERDPKSKRTAKESLQDRLHLLSMAVEQTSEGIAVVDLEGNLLYVNPAFAGMHGYTPEELRDKHLSIFHSPQQMEAVVEANEQLKDSGRFEGEVWHLRRDGEVFLTYMRNTVLHDSDGTPVGMLGTMRDITEQKEAEEKLKESTQRLVKAERVARMGFLDWNLKTDQIYLSDGIYHLFGLEPGENLTAPELIEKAVHPEDVDFVREKLEAAAQGSEQVDFDHRIVRPDGELVWVYSLAELIRDSDGNPDSLVGTAVDITSRKQAEARLQLLGQITEQVTNSVLTTGPDFAVTYTNRAFTKLYGYTMAEVLGRSPDLLNAEPMAKEIQNDIYQTVTSGRAWTGEVMNRKKDGTKFPCELMVFPLLDENGSIFAYSGSQRDITERRQAEDKLRKTTDELQNKQKELLDKNTALTEILDHIEEQRQDYRHRICREIEQALLPVLKRARHGARPLAGKALDALEENVKELLNRDIDLFKDYLSKLTPRELEICDLLKKGKSSKEIAAGLNMALVTVNTHRQRIRKKLGINNKGINLSTWLRMY